MKRVLACVSLCASAVLAGCATSGANEVLAQYRLPIAQYEVQASYQLQACPSAGDLTSAGTSEARILITAVVTAAPGIDPNGGFVVSRGHVSSARTSGEATVNFYPNRTIKSLNVVSEDRTGAVIANVIGILSSAARIAATPLTAAGDRFQQPCTDSAVAALQRKATLEARIRQLEAELLVGDFNAQQTTARRTEIEALRLDRQNLIASSLSFSRTFAYTPDAAPEGGQAETFFTPDVSGTFVRSGADTQQLRVGVNLVALEPAYAESAAPPSGVRQTTRPDVDQLEPAQLVLRDPVSARLYVCRGECRRDSAPSARPQNALAVSDVLVPQWGQYRVVSLRAGLFDRRGTEIAFGPYGEIQTLKATGNARAEVASQQLGVALERLRTARDEVEASPETRGAAALQRETQLLNAQRELLEARRRLQEEIERDATP